MAKKIINYRTKLILLSLGFTLFGVNPSFSQASRLNFGLSQKQDPSTLPTSTVKTKMPVRKAKVNKQATLQKIVENEYLLGTGWELADADKVTSALQSIFNPEFPASDWYNAIVPGTVLTTLVDQGVYPDP